jgi:methylated-DNA-[protein]-cysteine S-methyltransferase
MESMNDWGKYACIVQERKKKDRSPLSFPLPLGEGKGEGKRQVIEPSLYLAILHSMTPFQTAVRLVVSRIPKGTVMTYAEVALRAGYSGAARAVGSLMKENFDASIPCHRVICSSGFVGDYNRGGSEKKADLLRGEGVSVNERGRVQ